MVKKPDVNNGSGKGDLWSRLAMGLGFFCAYLALSLTGIWGALPPLVQVVCLGLVVLLWLMLARPVSRRLSVSRRLFASPFPDRLFGMILSVILFGGMIFVAGDNTGRRLDRALKPRLFFPPPEPEITMTVTPPAYSGRVRWVETVWPAPAQGAGLNPVPEGSHIKIQVRAMTDAPGLQVGHADIAFTASPEGVFAADFIVNDEAYWAVTDDRQIIGRWPLAILEDAAPEIAQADFRPLATKNGFFGLSLDLADDYGLSSATVAVRAVTAIEPQPAAVSPILLPIAEIRHFSGDVYLNLGDSDLAGRPVDLVITAQDQAGQTRQKTIPVLILPAREFSHPIARKIVEIRQDILNKPLKRKSLARQIMALGLGQNIDDGLGPVYYIGLRSAWWRLNKAKNPDDIASARQILWQLAVALDAGTAAALTPLLLADLAAVKAQLYQARATGTTTVEALRSLLQAMDKKIILFLQDGPGTAADQALAGKIDLKTLRGLYNKILRHSHDRQFDQALQLVSYLEYGFIYGDAAILSGKNYAQFQKINQAQDSIKQLAAQQRRIIAFVYKNQITPELASIKADIMSEDGAGAVLLPAVPQLAASTDLRRWVQTQDALRDDIQDLGRSLLKSKVRSADITVAAAALMQDAANSMESGHMEEASRYQTEIMMLLGHLQRLLDQALTAGYFEDIS